MKKFLFGFLALILALGAVAFTKADQSPKDSYYWFQYDASGNEITQSSVPASLATDPASCGGVISLCSQGFNDYMVVPNSSPVRYQSKGSPLVTHKRN